MFSANNATVLLLMSVDAHSPPSLTPAPSCLTSPLSQTAGTPPSLPWPSFISCSLSLYSFVHLIPCKPISPLAGRPPILSLPYSVAIDSIKGFYVRSTVTSLLSSTAAAAKPVPAPAANRFSRAKAERVNSSFIGTPWNPWR